MTEFAGEVTSSVCGSPKERQPQISGAVIVIGAHSVVAVFPGGVVDRFNSG
jgi:hypothetical protein